MNTENESIKDLKNLNPRVSRIKIGTRNLREISIWPLSVRDELELSELISKALISYFDTYDEKKKIVDSELNTEATALGILNVSVTEIDNQTMNNMEFISFIMDLIKDNLEKILKFTIDKEEFHDDLLSEMDNFQLIEIVNIIYLNNFENVAKNARSLFEKVIELFLLERPLPESVKNMDIKSKMSSESPLEKED